MHNSAFIDTWFMNQNTVYLITVTSAFAEKASEVYACQVNQLIRRRSNFLSTDFLAPQLLKGDRNNLIIIVGFFYFSLCFCCLYFELFIRYLGFLYPSPELIFLSL